MRDSAWGYQQLKQTNADPNLAFPVLAHSESHWVPFYCAHEHKTNLKTNLWKDFGIQVGRTAGNREKSTSLQTDEVIEMQGRPKRINLSWPVKESWSLCFHFWYLNWQSTSEADIYWSCSLKTILVKFRAHTGKRQALNTTGKFLKLLLIAEKKKREINSIYRLGMCMGSI